MSEDTLKCECPDQSVVNFPTVFRHGCPCRSFQIRNAPYCKFKSRETIFLIIQMFKKDNFKKKSSLTILKLLSRWPHILRFSVMGTDWDKPSFPGEIYHYTTELFKLTQVHCFIRVLNQSSIQWSQYLSVCLPCTSVTIIKSMGHYFVVSSILPICTPVLGTQLPTTEKSKPCP